MILVDNVTSGFNTEIVIKDLTLLFNKGETYSIIGKSGCGKSTLLMLLARLKEPCKGKIINKFTKLSIVFQKGALFPWKTVEQNIRLTTQIRKIKVEEDYFNHLLVEIDLVHLLSRYPFELSGGQRQRVALARALLSAPDVLLLDEPFSALDFAARKELRSLVLSLQRKYQFTLVSVTHHIDEAVYLGQKVIILNGRPVNKTTIAEGNIFRELEFDDNEIFNLRCKEVLRQAE